MLSGTYHEAFVHPVNSPVYIDSMTSRLAVDDALCTDSIRTPGKLGFVCNTKVVVMMVGCHTCSASTEVQGMDQSKELVVDGLDLKAQAEKSDGGFLGIQPTELKFPCKQPLLL
ncbi:hypothetical protein C4D60_Mb07t22030 [Musa balbisiana]|uniref:Uncharacterized protein n=1 Tax=Musa balbisiana TaxID=52838 RepID=A0A4S8JH39_MUSBA|nr:hypothetical protein C4D60_Mb07t22030 [Musa balbisiana]